LLKDWPAAAALGNNDVDRLSLLATAADLGIQMSEVREGVLDSTRVAVVHGHHRPTLMQAVRSGLYDLIVTGHSHRLRDERVGSTRVANPGALYRAARYTCAVLNTGSGVLEIIPVPK